MNKILMMATTAVLLASGAATADKADRVETVEREAAEWYGCEPHPDIEDPYERYDRAFECMLCREIFEFNEEYPSDPLTIPARCNRWDQ